jgi:threonine-phosphate decarboxylase
MIKGHGGNIYDLARQLGCSVSDIVDMSSNMNPLGPPKGLLTFLTEHIDRINALPEPDAGTPVNAFAERLGISTGRVLAGNGTTQFIYTLPQALESKKALVIGPTYADYADACIMHHVPVEHLFAEESSHFKPNFTDVENSLNGVDTVFICNPNNPTGVLIPADELRVLCRAYPDIHFIVDESYLPFADKGWVNSMIQSGLSNIIVLSSLSKIFRIPGLRIGFLVSSEEVVEKLVPFALPWNVNSLAQAAVEYLMTNEQETHAFIKETQRFLETERETFTECFHDASHIRFFPSTTSYILARLLGNHTAERVCDFFAKNRTLIRNCGNFKGLSNRFLRISLKSSGINRRAAQLLFKFFEG